jgi:hypothetical protein
MYIQIRGFLLQRVAQIIEGVRRVEYGELDEQL